MSQTTKKTFVKETFSFYLRAAGKYPWALSGSLLAMVGVQLVALASPWFMRTFFNTLVAGEPSALLVTSLLGTLGIIAFLSFLNWALLRIEFFCLVILDGKVLRDLYDVAFRYLITHSYHFFTNQFAGTLTRRVGRFSKSFETMADTIIMQFIPTAIFIIGAVVILWSRSPLLGGALLLWVVLVLVVQFLALKFQKNLRLLRTERDSELTGALADAIGNQNTIQLFSASKFEVARVKEVAERWYRATVKSWHASEVTWGALSLLAAVVNIILLYIAVILWQKNQLTIGDFVLIQAYLITAIERLFSINRELRSFNEAIADAGEMSEILTTPHSVQDVPKAPRLVVSAAHIAFTNVDFYFTPEHPILSHLSISITGGEKIALVGPSGAGKTTITKLLLRLYDVNTGTITIDGQDISKVTQDSLREAIAFVPQEPILFHRTLMENIRYGRRDASDREVVEAARQAHCLEFIEKTPEGMNTFVGERGIKLSGGERQRIAIARAILKNAPILVLDEATSSLDSESESLIQDALAKLMEDKTVIAIAHRLSTVMKMDRILVIEDGAVVTSGTHDELVRQEGGLYKKLWDIQAGGFIQDS